MWQQKSYIYIIALKKKEDKIGVLPTIEYLFIFAFINALCMNTFMNTCKT